MSRIVVFGGTTGLGGAITERLMTPKNTIWVVGASQGYDFTTQDGLAQIWRTMRQCEPNQVVYNAGINVLMPLDDLNGDIVEQMYMVNVYGLMIALREFAKIAKNCPVKDEGYHRFVHIGSIAARVQHTHSIAYCSSKAAARQAAMTAGRELGPIGAYVNTVAPGPIKGTAMTRYVQSTVPKMRGWSDEEAEAYQLAAIPLRHRVDVADVVSMVDFLLDPDKAHGITGSEFVVSGGL